MDKGPFTRSSRLSIAMRRQIVGKRRPASREAEFDDAGLGGTQVHG